MALQQIRYVEIQNKMYLRVEDVIALLRDFGYSEEPDVRTRLAELEDSIVKAIKKQGTRNQEISVETAV